MPLSDIPTHLKQDDYRANLALPIPFALRSTYPEPVRLRHAFADWVDAKPPHLKVFVPRKLFVSYLREIGQLGRHERLIGLKMDELHHRYGPRFMHWLAHADSEFREAISAHARRLREENSRNLKAPEPLPLPAPVAPVAPPVDEAEQHERNRAESRAIQRYADKLNRERFCDWLEEGKNDIVWPSRMFRQWAKPDYLAGVGDMKYVTRPYFRTAFEARRQFGDTAAHAIMANEKMRRHELAQLLRKL